MAEAKRKVKAEARDEGATVAQVRALRAKFPALDADEAGYFAARQPVEQAREAGSRTVAATVLPDMARLVVRYEQAREASPTVAAMVTPAQMRWLCDGIVALDAAVAQRDRKGVKRAAVSTAVTAAWDDARAARNELTSAMEEYAKADDADAASLSAARGNADDGDNAARSLDALSALAAQWLARAGKRAQIAAREASLTAATVQRAREAAKAMRDALDAEAAHGGTGRLAQDTPEINTIEGQVILSLRMVRHNHRRAQERDPAVPAVQVPDSLKGALGLGKKKAKDAPETSREGTSGAGGATPEAPKVRAAKTKRRKKR